jgi:uncharacterized RDD family membrane protein YckC
MDEQNTAQQGTGLAEELESFVQYEQASTGQRFVNLLIDNLVMNFGLSFLTGMVIGYILQVIAPDFLYRFVYEKNTLDVLAVNYMAGILNYLLYYTVCEKAFKGYTLGKLVSGSRAIRNDGGELTFKNALLRSLSRLVPFEVLSGFGTPWHDSWTNTTVVKTRR